MFALKVVKNMIYFIIKKLPYDLSSHAGVANSDILKSYLGLLCLGKNDFDAIENFRTNPFFKRALGLVNVPSSPTLRQRLDANASSW